MDHSEQRDAAEERYNREFCVPCGISPCDWDGEPDGFHTDDEPASLDQLTIELCMAAFGVLGLTARALDLLAEAVLVTDQISGSAEAMLGGPGKD